MATKTLHRVATLSSTTVATIGSTSTRAAAAHGSLPCSIPPSMEPLFALLHTLTQIAFLGGVSLGTLGFTVAGLLIAGPFGPDYAERGKQLVKQVLIGVVLILSAQMIISLLIGQLGGAICT